MGALYVVVDAESGKKYIINWEWEYNVYPKKEARQNTQIA